MKNILLLPLRERESTHISIDIVERAIPKEREIKERNNTKKKQRR